MIHLEEDIHRFSPDSLRPPSMSVLGEDMPSEMPLFDDFNSDEENWPSLPIDLHYASDSSDGFEKDLKSEVKRNRRKATTPQRAVQSDFCFDMSRNEFMDNSSDSSQEGSRLNDLDSVKASSSYLPEETNYIGKYESLPENLFDFELDNGDISSNFQEEDIFRDLQEEADGEPLDKEIISSVEEEWRAHWGVKCNMCELVFPLKTQFDEHYMCSYSLYPIYTCTFCNKSCVKYSTFRSHCYRHITEGRYKCEICSKGFSLQSLLHVHILAKHTKAKPFMCEECGKSFVTRPGLKIHLRKHKTENKEDYPCVVCGKVLHTRGGLTSHMNVHRLGRRFMCDICGKTFTQKVNMIQHVKQHTGDKPHTCGQCGKTFAERSHLNRHSSFHSDKRPYKCPTCNKMYKTERCLKVHSLVHAKERPFICKYCSKGFLSSTKLKQHYNIHTGERPYKCKYCERTFTNFPNWLKHTRRRHKVDHKTGADLNPPQPKKPVKIRPKPDPKSSTVSKPKPKKEVTEVKVEQELNIKTESLQLNHEIFSPLEKLEIKSPPSISSTTENDQTQSTEHFSLVSDHLINDLSLAKAEEMLLHQGLINFPVLDDKLVLSQQMDLLTGTSSTFTSNTASTHYFIPYFQTTLPNQTIIQTTPANLITVPIQLNELITTNFVQQNRN